jgi:integrase
VVEAAPVEIDPDQGAEPEPEPQRRALADPGGVRLQGPHPHDGGWRYRIITSAGRSWAATGRTEAQALKLAETAAAKHARQGNITIADALDSYIQYKVRCGVQPTTQSSQRNGVQVFFRGLVDGLLCRVTQRVCQAQYDRLQQQIDPRTGRLISVATHRHYLAISRGFFRWVVEQGWIAESPIERVRGVGRRRRGKVQLTLDEAQRLSMTCRQEATCGDEGAIATLMCMHMGLRAFEALSRVVRDIDKDGTVLRIEDNEGRAFRLKTGSSKRTPKIPTFLRPILTARTLGKAPTDALFPGTLGGRRRRQWLNDQVERLCIVAAVPVVCPHSLRGIFATAAASAGETPEIVAQVLGHTDPAMTIGHYIAPGTLEQRAVG